MSGFKVQFDDCWNPAGSVEVIPNEEGDLEIWISTHDKRAKILSSWRDQWRVYIGIESLNLSIAQEDKTRSFLDAMSQAFQYLRTQVEGGTLPGEVNV